MHPVNDVNELVEYILTQVLIQIQRIHRRTRSIQHNCKVSCLLVITLNFCRFSFNHTTLIVSQIFTIICWQNIKFVVRYFYNNDFTMTYQLYRNTTLGNTLQESLDELVQVHFICLYNFKLLYSTVFNFNFSIL